MGVIPTTKATSTTASFPQPPQSPQVAPALIGHETRAALIGITCMLLVLCIAAVAGRVAARRIARAALQADDYISALALVSQLLRPKRTTLTSSSSCSWWHQLRIFSVGIVLKGRKESSAYTRRIVAHYISKLQGPGPPSIEAVRVVGHVSSTPENPCTAGC